MFVDASALVAIIGEEDDGQALAERFERIERSYTSALAIYEATLALARVGRMSLTTVSTLLDDFITRSRIEIVPITAEIGSIAIDAFAGFGRGNHPARLNMGDCFAYACARSLGVPLLCKGGDFSQTDIVLA
ncbi:MAG TPA: type II toxin-antitoxin system VapC family toxin [Stellaceae bacterium]|nr:type II toxin-antitoxin system VapC family toxin [Stellaceae bacterium]